MRLIDAHAHYNGTCPELHAMFDELDLKSLDVCVAHGGEDWRVRQAENYRRQAAEKTPDEIPGWVDWMRESYLQQKSFYETDGDIMIGPRASVGIGLPEDVVEKIYFRNAARIYPGLNP